jgi:galactose mutarotase-like enzyme
LSNSVSLFSGEYKAEILNLGAELSSLLHLPTNEEYIWSAEPSIWPRHAPVLFPFVGRLKNFEYRYKGRSYNIEQHGFARDLEFNILQKTSNSATFELTENKYTLQRYPFHFQFKVTYTLWNNKLTMAFDVYNNGVDNMPVSFGGHPAFNILNPEDTHIIFENDPNPLSWILDDNFIGKQTKTVSRGNGIIEVNKSTFEKDALVFKGLKSKWVKLYSKSKEKGIKINLNDWPYLGIWSKPNANFICIEPWQGIADSIDFNGDIFEKEGILCLKPHGQIHKSFDIELI